MHSIYAPHAHTHKHCTHNYTEITTNFRQSQKSQNLKMLLADISMKTILQKIRKHKFVAAAIALVCFVGLVVVLVVYGMCRPTSLRMNQLPLPVRPHLVGREERIYMIEGVLLNNNYNTVFIVGPPGVGKSAVAITIGYEFINKHLMEVLYVNMEDLEIRNLEIFMANKFKAENWVKKLSTKVLLILDNCDKHTIDPESLRRLHKQIDKWVHDTTMLTILVTNQAEVPWPTNALSTFSLDYLNSSNIQNLLLQRILQITKAEDITMLQELIVDGMPLAVENIVDYLQSSTSPGLEYLLSSVKTEPNQAINIFTSKHLVHVIHTVFKSISIAYNSLNKDDNKECVCRLVQKFGLEEFDANTAFNQLEGTSDCISNLVQAQLLITRTVTVEDVQEPDCMIQSTKFLISCNNPKGSRIKYRFHPLIASYIHVHVIKQRTKRGIENKISAHYQHFVKNGLKRTYCPHQYMQIICSQSWVVATNGMLDRMASKQVQFNERVQIGVLATYWNRVIFKGVEFSSKSYRYVSTLINSTLTEKWNPKYENTQDLLAAYVFYNHASLRITWEAKNGQHQCFCPDPKEAVTKMMPRKKNVDYWYSQITNNHMAWSASRSFYLDLTCCCRAMGECEHRWRYWIKGIVSQTATARMFFQDVMKSKCSDKVKGLPPRVPVIIEGLWHYEFTKEKDKAAELLEEYLQEHVHTDCPILKLAAIMVLHDIYHDTENEECDVALGNHINNSSELIDTSIANYKRFYREVIIPFLHEIGKNKIATELASMLNSPPSKTVKEKTFECRLLYQHHWENFHEFFCLTL